MQRGRREIKLAYYGYITRRVLWINHYFTYQHKLFQISNILAVFSYRKNKSDKTLPFPRPCNMCTEPSNYD